MKVFISHASTDAKLAKRVAHVLREAGFQVWDETQILPGDNWGTQLSEALQESEEYRKSKRYFSAAHREHNPNNALAASPFPRCRMPLAPGSPRCGSQSGVARQCAA